MSEYRVDYEITGIITIYVKASDKSEALDKAETTRDKLDLVCSFFGDDITAEDCDRFDECSGFEVIDESTSVTESDLK